MCFSQREFEFMPFWNWLLSLICSNFCFQYCSHSVWLIVIVIRWNSNKTTKTVGIYNKPDSSYPENLFCLYLFDYCDREDWEHCIPGLQCILTRWQHISVGGVASTTSSGNELCISGVQLWLGGSLHKSACTVLPGAIYRACLKWARGTASFQGELAQPKLLSVLSVLVQTKAAYFLSYPLAELQYW